MLKFLVIITLRQKMMTYTVSQKTFTLVLVLQGNVATKLSNSGKFFIHVMSHFFLIPTLKEF